ncbi:hypothetical protein F5887DRAFT_924981 [Amanita rubescens]|nr:hypothetical protein F5887DRAFT_924981 [Amanita rubescens]
MAVVPPSNKEEEIASSSLSAILVALVDAVDRLTLQTKSLPLEAEVLSAAQSTEYILVPSIVGSATPSEGVSESDTLPAVQDRRARPCPWFDPAPPEVNANPAVPNPAVPSMAPTEAGPSSVPHIPTPADVRARYEEMPSTASKTWFVVTRGRLPGVYATWMETSPLVIGVSRAVFNKYTTKEEALAAYGAAWASGHVTRFY